MQIMKKENLNSVSFKWGLPALPGKVMGSWVHAGVGRTFCCNQENQTTVGKKILHSRSVIVTFYGDGYDVNPLCDKVDMSGFYSVLSNYYQD